MKEISLAVAVAFCTVPPCASASTVALVPENLGAAACTLTMNFVPATPPAPSSGEPIIFVASTQSYPIKSFTVQRTQRPHSASIATVTADLALESTIATLLDQHAIIERADLVCPSKNVTLTNATIGYIETSAASHRSLSFEMNFWPKDLAMTR